MITYHGHGCKIGCSLKKRCVCACSEFGGRTQRKARLTITKGREAEKGRALIGLKTKLLFSRAGKANLHGPCQGSLKYANPEAEVEAGDAWLCKTTILPAFRLLPSFSELKHHPLEIVVNKNTILCIISFTVASDGDISSWMMRNRCDWSYQSHASNVLQKSYACPWRRSATLHDSVFLAVQYVFFLESFCRISR